MRLSLSLSRERGSSDADMEGRHDDRPRATEDPGVDVVRDKVAGKGFLRLRTEAEGGLVVLCDLNKKEVLLRSGDPAFYTTPHYEGYPAILVNLKKVKRAELVDLITESWRRKAPLKLLKEFDASSLLG